MAQKPVQTNEFQRMDELCDRFEDALKRGERPTIEDWLADAGSIRGELLPELVALKLDYRIRAGEQTTASDYFEQFPELIGEQIVAMRLVETEWRAMKARDPNASEERFRERYPDFVPKNPSQGKPVQTTSPMYTTSFSETPGETATDAARSALADPMVFLRGVLEPSDRSGGLGRFGDFHIQRILGAGGMGVVLEALDGKLNRRVAIKLMRPEVAARTLSYERFLREARALAAVEHPRIVLVHQVGEQNGVPYLVMPLMAGQSLGSRMKSESPLPISDAIRFAREAAEGLAAAHANRVIHRDIKPDNIWLEETADGIHVRLLDFGLARDDAAESITQTGAICGTLAYMAPEQASGEKVDPRADLFSLGCVLFEVVTGTKAFPGTSVTSVLFSLANHTPPAAHSVNPQVPESLSAIIHQLLNKDRDQRPETADHVAHLLRSLEQGDPNATVSWYPQSGILPFKRYRRPNWLIAGGVALSLAVICGIIAINNWPERGKTNAISKREDPLFVPKPVEKPVPLTVRSIEVQHYVPVEGGDRPEGVLSKDSTPRLGDKVQVIATLSKPAYAYILAFRPDGVIELCYPESEDAIPNPTDEPRYPTREQTESYGLFEGTGLWLFAVVASEKPLPAYKEWIAMHKLDWKPELSVQKTVNWYPEELDKTEGRRSTVRGKNVALTGPAAALVKLGNQLESDELVPGIIGFGVAPRLK